LSCKTPVKHLVPTGQGEWFAPSNIEDLLAVLDQMEPGKTARFVGGNTGRGKCPDFAQNLKKVTLERN
jgi:hypothetical protein